MQCTGSGSGGAILRVSCCEVAIQYFLDMHCPVAEYPLDAAIQLPEQRIARMYKAGANALIGSRVPGLQRFIQQQVMAAEPAKALLQAVLAQAFYVEFSHQQGKFPGLKVYVLCQLWIQQQKVIVLAGD